MGLIKEGFRALINKFILRKSNGEVARIFCTNMGIVYIKLGQILAMQNINGVFSEEDRQSLLSICTDCNRVSFESVYAIIKQKYKDNIPFISIEEEPIGSASVSQVHKAILKEGNQQVAVKVKRRDIVKTIEKDIKQIKFCIKHFGKFVDITNFIGSYKALDFYLKWISEEVDFIHEANNIITYTKFANNVNSKVKGCKLIKVPKLYKEYCTENIIVMEYIPYKTISELQATPENSDLINEAVTSYIKLSFYALFNRGIPLVWHGDPHAGNIYIDDEGNIGFLDLGLIFELTESEKKMTLDFFFCAYFGNYNKLFNMLSPYIKEDNNKKEQFRKACKEYCKQIKTESITHYFMDLVWVCLEYSISPPDFLYGMAKAFICLFGIDIVYKNETTGKDIITEQVLEFLIDIAVEKSKYLGNLTLNTLKSIIYKDKNKLIHSIIGYEKLIKGEWL